MPDALTSSAFAQLPGLDDWRIVLNRIDAHFRAGSFEGATSLARTIAAAAEAVQHHPDIDIRYPDRVHVVLDPAALPAAVADHDAVVAACARPWRPGVSPAWCAHLERRWPVAQRTS